MAIKVVLLFQQTTLEGPFGGTGEFFGPTPVDSPSIGYGIRRHIGGWTESLWWDANTLTPLLNAIRIGYGGKPALGPARAALLANGASIIGARLYAGGAGKGQSVAFSFPGDATQKSDVPQIALLMKAAPTSATVSRRSTLRGIPDYFVRAGEFAPDTAYTAAVANYFQALGNFSFYAVDPASPQAQIFNITAAGLVTTTTAPQPFAVGQLVTIQKAVGSDGIFHTWTGTVVTTGPNTNQFTINGGPGLDLMKGKAIIKQKALFLINPVNCAISRVVVRKVGRPSEQYRGRRSKRRRTA